MELSKVSSTEVGDLFIEECFLVVIELIGPGEVSCYFGLSVVVDEDVDWSDISNFLTVRMHCVSCFEDSEG